MEVYYSFLLFAASLHQVLLTRSSIIYVYIAIHITVTYYLAKGMTSRTTLIVDSWNGDFEEIFKECNCGSMPCGELRYCHPAAIFFSNVITC